MEMTNEFNEVININFREDYNAYIEMGGLRFCLHRNKPFTEKQIKNIKEYFGWEAGNIEMSEKEQEDNE